ncbi:MAG: TlyA family RNA methyltransferase [Pseudomonadota bacterium]
MPGQQTAGERLDRRLVALGLVESRARAARMIAEGRVTVDGRPAAKPSQTVAAGARLAVAPGVDWVSRGALKLLHALDRFALTPTGTALDVGASTGGFTEVLLARGATRVYALDVGRGQLHPRLGQDPRVTAIEGVNCRAIPAGQIPAVDWIVADLSFIALAKALPGPMALARPGATLVALVKPQFEVGRASLGKGGIVRDAAARRGALEAVAAWLAETQGWRVLGTADSPIEGGDGNREYLIAARAPAGWPGSAGA